MSDPDPTFEAEVRRAEPDLWLASRLVADLTRRAALIALYAVHVELGKVAAAAANPLAGEIRLAWWREEVEALFTANRASGHPALQALRSAPGLDRAALEAMIEARHAELEPKPFEHEAPLVAYLDGVYGALMQAATGLTAPGAETKTTQAGRAYGWARLLQDRPLWRARSRAWTPAAWGDASDEEIAAHVRHRVSDALTVAKAELGVLSTAAFPAFAPTALAQAYARNRQPSPLEKRLRLLWASLTGRL